MLQELVLESLGNSSVEPDRVQLVPTLLQILRSSNNSFCLELFLVILVSLKEHCLSAPPASGRHGITISVSSGLVTPDPATVGVFEHDLKSAMLDGFLSSVLFLNSLQKEASL